MTEKIPAAMSLPARYYIDPDYYRSELEWFFCGMWFHAGRADEIPNRGDFVRPRDRRREPDRRPGRAGRDQRVLQRLPPPGHAAVRASRSGTIRVHDPMSLSCLDLRPGRLSGRRPAHGPRRRVSAWRITRSAGWRSTSGMAMVFLNFGGAPAVSLKAQLGGLDERFRAWGMGELRTGETDRLRRRGQLEADHPQLFGVPALPGGPPGLAEAVALPQRRERAGGGRLPRGPDGAARRDRHALARRPAAAGLPARAWTPRSAGTFTSMPSCRTCC